MSTPEATLDDAPRVSRPDVLRALPRATLRALHGRDLGLLGAGVTFYAALSVVPLLIVTTRLATAVAGQDRVADLADTLGQALPSSIGADTLATDLVLGAAGVSWLVAAVCVVPASLYGEGWRRAFRAVVDPASTGPPEKLTGWRGRVAVLPVLALAPLLLLVVLGITPLLAQLFSGGAGATALGVYVALNVDWLVLAVPLAWSFRVVAPDPVPLRAAVLGGLSTAAFCSGFLQGFVLFLSLPLDLGAPFGGVVAVGAVIALLLWMWVLHMVVLIGFVATRAAVEMRSGAPSPTVEA